MGQQGHLDFLIMNEVSVPQCHVSQVFDDGLVFFEGVSGLGRLVLHILLRQIRLVCEV